MSFDSDAVVDGIGRVLRADISTDRFATVSFRFGSVAGLLDGANMYSARIISVGNVRRGFGQKRMATGGTTDLVLDNSDGAIDTLAGRGNMSTHARLRVRLYVSLFTPGAESKGATVFTSKLLGEFSLIAWPRRDNTTITLELGDDMLSSVGQLAALPTLLDWQGVGTTSNNPIKTSMGLPDAMADAMPVQIAFGEDWVSCLPHIIPWQGAAAYEDTVIVPVCCTTDLSAASDSLITSLRVQWQAYDETGDAGSTQAEVGVKWKDIPRTIIDTPAYGSSAPTDRTVWRVEKSPTITKDGKSFQIVYLVVSCSLGMKIYETTAHGNNFESTTLGQYQTLGGYPLAAIDWIGDNYKVTTSRVLGWYAKGSVLSARTQTADPIQHPTDVITDLLTHYSNGSSISIDTVERARVKAGNPNAACAGVVQGWSLGPKKTDPQSYAAPPSLRQVFGDICIGADFDIFVDWDGQLSFSSDVQDFTTATALTSMLGIVETECSRIEEWIPSEGERFSPYNRLYFTGGKDNPAEQVALGFQGPFDFDAGTSGISISDRIVEESLPHGWRPWRQQSFAPWFWRQLDTEVRAKIRFTIGLRGLLLELGQYFTFTWSRGDIADTVGAIFDTSVFQVESLTLAPKGDAVEVEAIWRNDITTERSYLLDDETLLARTKPSAASIDLYTITGAIFAGSTVNFTTMGVEGGDIIILRDSSQAATEFSRNRAIRILGLEDDFTLQLDSTDTSGISAFPTLATLINADWSIVRGATTYPTAVSDPTNYPSGGDMYGKVTNVDGEHSDASTGNKLING